MNDEETIAYYSSLADELGGSITVRYQNAIYLVFNETQIFTNIWAKILQANGFILCQNLIRNVMRVFCSTVYQYISKAANIMTWTAAVKSISMLKMDLRRFFRE